MKKALLSLLILVLVMIPVLVSCEDTSQLEKIGQLMSDFSGVGKKVTPEQAQKQTEQAASTIEEKFKEENLENLDFKEISNMFYDFPEADLNQKTSIDKGKLNELISEKITPETQAAMKETKEVLDEMVKPGKINYLGEFGEVAEDVVGKISRILDVFTNITSNTKSTGEQATLKDVKEASAAASMYGELAEIAGKFTGMMGDGPGPTPEPTEEDAPQLLSDLMTGLDNYNNAAKAYAEAAGEDASEFTIDLESLAGQFLGEM